MSFLNKPSDELILDLVNAQIKKNNLPQVLTLGQVSIGAVVAHVGDDDRNSTVTIMSIPGVKYVGNVDCDYWRLDLAKLFLGISVNLDVEDPQTTADLVTKLNSKYGLALGEDDFVNDPVSGNTAIIKAKAASPAYFGEISVTIGPDDAVGERLSLVILERNLDGLLYPNTDTTKAQASIYSYGIDANAIAPWLKTQATGTDIDDNALITELNKVVPELWVHKNTPADYNTGNARIIFAGPNSADLDANQEWTHVVQIALDPTLCTNMGGVLTLGYNSN